MDFDKYPDYFRPSTTFTLPEGGTYTGAEDIEEYVRFASSYSPFIEATNLAESVDLNLEEDVLPGLVSTGASRRRMVCPPTESR